MTKGSGESGLESRALMVPQEAIGVTKDKGRGLDLSRSLFSAPMS